MKVTEKIENKFKEAVMKAAIIASRLDCMSTKTITEKEVMKYVSSCIREMAFDGMPYTVYYSNGKFMTRGMGVGQNISVTLPFAVKTALKGAVLQKCEESASIVAAAEGEKAAGAMEMFIHKLPAEAYIDLPFAHGWIMTAALEYVLETWGTEHAINTLKPELSYSIVPADENRHTYNPLYGTECQFHSLHIMCDNQLLCCMDISTEQRNILTSAVRKKIKEAETLKQSGQKGFQEKAAKVMDTLAEPIMDRLTQILADRKWMAKHDLDAALAGEAGLVFADFMKNVIPYSAHFIESCNEIYPEVYFDFDYATSAYPSKPKGLFVRFAETHTWFTERQSDEFFRKSSEILRVAKYMDRLDEILDEVTDILVTSMPEIPASELIDHGFEMSINKLLTDIWRKRDALYNLADNKTEASLLMSEDGTEAEGILITGSLTGTRLFEFSESEKEGFSILFLELCAKTGFYG